MICAIVRMWRSEPPLPFIMVKGCIIIWMTTFNNRVLGFKAETGWDARIGGFTGGPRFLRGGLWEVKVVLWCEACLLRKDKWSNCRVTTFFLSPELSSSSLSANISETQNRGRWLHFRCKSLSAGVGEIYIFSFSQRHRGLNYSLGFSFLFFFHSFKPPQKTN